MLFRMHQIESINEVWGLSRKHWTDIRILRLLLSHRVGQINYGSVCRKHTHTQANVVLLACHCKWLKWTSDQFIGIVNSSECCWHYFSLYLLPSSYSRTFYRRDYALTVQFTAHQLLTGIKHSVIYWTSKTTRQLLVSSRKQESS